MRHLLLATLLGTGLGSHAWAALPATTQVTANITADAHYGLYIGQPGSGNFARIGQNKLISALPGGLGWAEAESWSFSAIPGDHLYVVARDSAAPYGWLGEFNWTGGGLSSNTGDWQYTIVPRKNAGQSDALPNTTALNAHLGKAQWQTPLASTANGSGVWGILNGNQPVAGISPSANWIWHDTLTGLSSSERNFVVFRTAQPLVTAVPEASTYAMLGLGVLMVLGAVRQARRQRFDCRIG